MKKITWIGTGVMGHAMVTHLINAGYPITIYTRSKQKALDLADKARLVDSIEEAVKEADVVMMMVGYPSDVESVAQQIFMFAPKGTLIIDMTTSSPSLAISLYQQAKAAKMSMLDAPVSGGDIGAKNASLTIMVGGDESDFSEASDILKHLGKSINLIGSAGFGQHCKMANQIVVAGNTVAISEAIHYMLSTGLDPIKTLNALGGGAASSWQLLNNGPKMINKNFEPGFYVHHFVKDLELIEEEARQASIDLPMVHQVLNLYRRLIEDGDRELGTQALIRAYRKD
ncbi:MAG: 3-hydroxyisobutyrate dehydrogenase [Erysipelotrichaceae bacterium]|nr:MAG: 3-hydroxyisobutyrate [Erysipelotrichaceae bacterium]TXT17656.1 MAG: 3-hydroxyisobutyrate dehydrogenase [Erysipelotrichaceae bacterium]